MKIFDLSMASCLQSLWRVRINKKQDKMLNATFEAPRGNKAKGENNKAIDGGFGLKLAKILLKPALKILLLKV